MWLRERDSSHGIHSVVCIISELCAQTFPSTLPGVTFFSKQVTCLGSRVSTFPFFRPFCSRRSTLHLQPSPSPTTLRMGVRMKHLESWTTSRASLVLLANGSQWKRRCLHASHLTAKDTSMIILPLPIRSCSSIMATSLAKPFPSSPVVTFLSNASTLAKSMAWKCSPGR